MFCQKCGSKVEDNSMFCPNCGNSMQTQATPVAPVMPQEPVAPVMPQEPVAPVMPQEPVADLYANQIPVMPEQNQWNQPSAQYAQPNSQFVPNNGMNQNTYGQPTNSMPPKKSKALPIILSIVAVLLVIAIVVVCIFIARDKKKDDNNTTTTKEVITEDVTEPSSDKDETTTEQSSSVEDETTTKTSVAEGTITAITRNEIIFYIPAGFEENSSQEDNYIRYDTDGTALESFFFSYVDGQTYSEDDMYDAFEMQIENIYGTDYDYETYTNDEGIEFRHYHYDECTVLDGYYTDAYVYTDGEMVIYMENVTALDEPSNIEDIVDSVEFR